MQKAISILPRIPTFFRRDLPDERREQADMRNLVDMLTPDLLFSSVNYMKFFCDHTTHCCLVGRMLSSRPITGITVPTDVIFDVCHVRR